MGTTKRTTYSKEFKESVVRMINKEGMKASEVARNFGISDIMCNASIGKGIFR